MRTIARTSIAAAFALLFGATGPSSRPAAMQAQTPAAPQPTTTIRVTSDLVSTDAIVRDRKGQFIPDLKKSDFEIYEDGVKQDIVSFVLSHGGRTINQDTVRAAAVPQEGIFLPPVRPTADASGRVFLIFIDDLHLDFHSTPRTREILRKISKDLIHEGDLFGVVSTGTSSIQQQLTYDKQILDSLIDRVTGGAMKLSDIRKATWGSQGPLEVRHNAHVAFDTANELVKNLERVQNRRKAILYLSSGYDFNPLTRTRFEDTVTRMKTTAEKLTWDPFQMNKESQEQLNESDLIAEITYLTQAANRANASFYTIDPRGLVAGQDIDEEVRYEDWQDWLRETQTNLHVLAEETGGFAIVNQNDFDKGLKRIDSETSDYYLLGFYSNNPDPLKRRRSLEIRIVGRPDLDVKGKSEYTLRPLPSPPPSR